MTREAFPPALYVVSTPIGCVEDLSPRARDCLASVDCIAAEDTRVARTLLRRLGIQQKVLSYHDHNERARAPALVERIRQGGAVALISDAGTPLVSDPGFRLVRACIEAELPVVALPGPSAVLAALVVSGLPPDRFALAGFLPRRGPKRRAALEALRDDPLTLVFFESPRRIAETLADLRDVLGDRRAAVARELTKPDESVERGRLAELADRAAERERSYGELTIVVEGADSNARALPAEIDALIERLREEGLSARTIRDLLADVYGLSRAELYERILADDAE